jgi:tetratricopeptide (TPR) repeat protein
MINSENQFGHGGADKREAGRYLFACAALFIILLAIYGNSMQGEWHFDDFIHIPDNAGIRIENWSLSEIKGALYFEEKLWRPAAYLSFAANYYFGGADVFGYHAVNLLIHYVSALFLFLFLYNTFRLPLVRGRYGDHAYPLSLISTMLWATSPIQVLAVSYVVQRMTGMAGMFYIIALYCYLKGRCSPVRWRKIGFLTLCVLSGLLSVGSKENGALLPLSIFVFDLLLIQGATAENIRKNALAAVLPLVFIAVIGIYYVDPARILDGYANRPFTLWERLLTEPRVMVLYFFMLFYPVSSHYSFLHDIAVSRSLFEPWTTLPAMAIVFGLIGYACRIARTRPLISFSILFFFLNHAIEGTIIPLELIFEHRNYIPSMFLFVPVTIAMLGVYQRFSAWKPLRFLMVLFAALFILSQGFTVYMRNEILRYDATMWLDTMVKYPALSRPHHNIGTYYLKRGDMAKALKELRTALSLVREPAKPYDKAVIHYSLGVAYQALGDYDKAFDHFKAGFDLFPQYASPAYGLARIHLRRGDLKGADSYSGHAVERNPASSEMREFRSLVLLRQGRYDEALHEAMTARAIDDSGARSLALVGEIYNQRGDYDQAIRWWREFMKRNPESVDGWCALIDLYDRVNDRDGLVPLANMITDRMGNADIRDFLKEKTGRGGISIHEIDQEHVAAIIERERDR